ncbi:peroxisomal membrane protein pex14 [Thecaphora frezii]
MSEPSTSVSAAQVAPTGPPRQDMVASAVSFLSDPKVQSASMSQRISFLESKGLRPHEIDEALRQSGQAGGGGTAVSSGGPSYAQYGAPSPYQPALYGHMYAPPPPTTQGRDWRDWFIMAVVSGTVGYGVISLAKKYLMPHLQPPNANVLESDLDALTAKYDEVAAQLQALDAQTLAVKQGLDDQKAEVDKGIREVEDCVKAVRENEKRRDDELDQIKRDVENIKKELGSMFEQTKQAQTNSLSELQTELKSLKSLLVSRGSMGAGNPVGPGTPGPAYGANRIYSSGYGSPSLGTPGEVTPPQLPRPSIPAWQLAGAGASTPSSSAAKATGSDAATPAATTESAPATNASSSAGSSDNTKESSDN